MMKSTFRDNSYFAVECLWVA